ncbi:MAG: VWA domain-containing protein [Acidobacteriota bacterium]
MKKKRAFVSFLMLISLATPLYAQEEKAVRLKADLVQIDVIVTDRQKRPIVDLRKEDFVLLEDGAPQLISFFTLVRPFSSSPSDQPNQVEASSSDIQSEPGRFIFIILDQQHISPSNYPRIRDALSRFISEDISSEDQVAVVSTSGRMAVFNQVTRNKRILQVAINAFLGAGGGQNDAGFTLTAQDQSRLQQGGSAASTDDLYREHVARNTYRSLEAIAKSVEEAPGRKIAILISEDLPLLLSNDPFDTSGFDNFSYELQKVIGRSRRSGLVFYTVDPRGLTATIPGGNAAQYQGKSMLGGGGKSEDAGKQGDYLLGSRIGMTQLAAATGGFAVFNTNDLRAGLNDVLDDNKSYYLLAYYPTDSAQDGKFRRIKVVVKNRPDLVVRTRSGYLAQDEKSGKIKQELKQQRIKNALAALMPLRHIKISILKASATKALEGRAANMVVQIDARSWPFRQESGLRLGSLEVIGFAYDLSNRLANGFSKTVNMKLRPDVYARVCKEGINFRESIRLKKPGVYNLRVLVINNETGEMGTASEWVEVP